MTARPGSAATESAMPQSFPPVKGRRGGAADDREAEASTGKIEMAGPRAVYGLARCDHSEFTTPVFAGEQGEGLVVFTTRDKAALYLQTNRWDGFKAIELSPFELQSWLQQARGEGIAAVLVDPNWHAQERGAAQPGLALQQLRDFSGEGLYDEIWALGNP